jgi:D-beta-D-heptose 7-phosphate kinase / D-beta-D-heptose 1-phosphate adenosyltransferase
MIADTSELLKILDRLTSTNVLVVGDVMLDRYWLGNASRLSPEAPVPVVALRRVSNIPGGAANVAANVAALGAGVFLAGIVGNDEAGQALGRALRERDISDGYLVTSEGRPTTTKTRVLVHNQQIARVDDESDLPLPEADEQRLLHGFRRLLTEADTVVLSDYSKGCLSYGLASAVIEGARAAGKTVVVDPKCRDLSKYRGASVITPNLNEALAAAGIENGTEANADEAASRVLESSGADAILITLGEHGMKLYRNDDQPVHFPALARQVFDVTGAGDTVVALLGAAIGAGAGLHAAISFANIGAGIAVEKVGTSTVGLEELRHAILNGAPPELASAKGLSE